MKILQDKSRYITWVSGARSGKSLIGGLIASSEVTLPDRKVWIVGPTYDLAKKEFDHAIRFLSRFKLGAEDNLLNKGVLSIPSEGACSLKFDWGSSIETKSVENPKSLLGEELDLLILAEAACQPREPYERMLIGRLGSRQGRQLAFSTGAGDFGLFTEFVDNGRAKLKDWATYESSTIDANPTFSREEFELNRLRLDSKIFEEQFGGKLVSKRGLVFNLQNDKVLEINESYFQQIRTQPVFVSIKYTYNNKSFFTFVAYSNVTRSYIAFDEIVYTKVTLEDALHNCNEKMRGFKFIAFILDGFNYEIKTKIAQLGYNVACPEHERKLGKINSQMARVRLIQSLIRENRLVIMDTCPNLLDDFKNCRWPDKKKEGMDLLESELPLPKHFQSIDTVASVAQYLEGVR